MKTKLLIISSLLLCFASIAQGSIPPNDLKTNLGLWHKTTLESAGCAADEESLGIVANEGVTNTGAGRRSTIVGSDYGAVSSGNTHKFTGHQQDAATGQYYAKARYFTTQLGRWSQPEPLLKSIPLKRFLLNPQELNPYVYCGNNPLIYTDPTGKVYWKNLGMAALLTAGSSLEMRLGATLFCATAASGAGIVGGAALMAHGAANTGIGAVNIVRAIQEKKPVPTVGTQIGAKIGGALTMNGVLGNTEQAGKNGAVVGSAVEAGISLSNTPSIVKGTTSVKQMVEAAAAGRDVIDVVETAREAQINQDSEVSNQNGTTPADDTRVAFPVKERRTE